jgi:hypothetical protein
MLDAYLIYGNAHGEHLKVEFAVPAGTVETAAAGGR